MKTRKSLLLVIILSVSYFCVKAQEFTRFINESFESGFPENWSETPRNPGEVWTFTNGGAGNPAKPDAAAVGTRNASFRYSTDGFSSTLITKPVNLLNVKKPVLSFYYANIQRQGVDIFTVKYKTSNDGEWIVLEEFPVRTTDWEKREIILPQETWVATLYIGFYAECKKGFGVCIDEVILENREYEARQVDANQIGVWQASSRLPSGSQGYPIALSRLVVTGNNLTLKLSDVKYNYTGTNISDIDNFSLYYSRDSAFFPQTVNKLSGSATIEGNVIKFNSLDKELPTGKNFLWLCADISSNAPHGSIIDLEVASQGISTVRYEGSNQVTSSIPSTAKTTTGSTEIHESLIVNGFENNETSLNNKWKRSGCWEIGKPMGIGTGDPTYAFYGENVLATNLSGNYPPKSKVDSAISPSVSTKYYKDINLFYTRWLNVELNDNVGIYLYSDNDSTQQLYRNNGATRVIESLWRNIMHDVSRHANRKDSIHVKFAIDSSINQTTQRGGWNIDNFAITGDYIAQDAGIDSILPVERCGLTLAPTTFRATVRNYGGENITQQFNVGYSLDNGRTFTTKLFDSNLTSPRLTNNPNETLLEFEFDPIMLTAGLKQLVFKTFLNGDEDNSNDIKSQLLYVFPTISTEYIESFERNNGYWYPTGKNSTWAHGTPNGAELNSASDGTKAWVTKLNGNYSNNELSYLESPCFDLTNIPYPVFSFDYNIRLADSDDILKVEYSTNSGTTWNELPAHSSQQQNWSATGWNTSTSGFETAYTLLPDSDFGKNGIKFRFCFASNSEGIDEGVVIDNIKLFSLPYDVSLTATNFMPQDDCEIGDTLISFTLNNLGYRTILEGTKLPFTIKIDNKTEIQDTITLSTGIAKDENQLLTTTKHYRLASPRQHSIVIASQLTPNFGITSDDTLKTNVSVIGMPFYSLGADIGTTEIASIILDAGEASAGVDYTSYLWRFTQDLNPPAWTDITTTRTISGLDDNGYGYYAVTVTNAVGCSASDTIKIINSNQDVLVQSIENITSACTHNDVFQPTVILKHNAGNAFDGNIGFEVGISINGEEVLSEMHIPANLWENSTTEFTFNGTIDLSEYKNYDIRAYTKFANDVDKSNDTTKLSITTYGPPSLTFNYADTILTTEASMLNFIAICEAENPADVTYQWKRFVDFTEDWETLPETSNTLALSNIDDKSALYKVILTDVSGNNCGTSSDSVYVNTKDIGVSSILNLSDTTCFFEDGILIVAEIKNFGSDIYPAGTEFTASLQTDINYQEQTITLENELTSGGTVEVTFPNRVQVMLGDQDINAFVEAENDVNSLNNNYSITTHIIPQPTVDIELDTLLMAFNDNSTYTIIPIYSNDTRNYTWHNSTYSNIGSFPEYTIEGFPDEKYWVTTSNGFCAASDTLIVKSNDIAITEIVTPIDTCASSSTSYPVTVKIKNMGTPLAAGSTINITGTATTTNILFQQETPINLSKTVTLDNEWDNQEEMLVTLSPRISLSGKKSVNVVVNATPTNFEDVIPTNNSKEKTAFMLSYPTIQFTPNNSNNRIVLAETDTIRLSTRYFSYQWDGSEVSTVDTTYIVSASGNYEVTVTDYFGCSATRSVNLTFYVNDLGVESLVAPISACTPTSSEVVTIKVKNNGTYTIPSGTTITIGYKIGTGENHTETYTFESDFAPSETIDISFTQTIDMSTVGTYSIKTWVQADYDRVTTNDSKTTSITHYAPVYISNFNDRESCFGQTVTLTAEGTLGTTPTFSWNTGDSIQSINVTGAGMYKVTVTNENGCFATDSLMLTVHDLPIVQLIADTSICRGTNITIDAGNLGSEFLWNTGANTSSIIADTEGTYSVTVTDANGCSSSDETVISINELPTISLGDDTEICKGQSYVIDAGPGATAYLWSTSQTTQTIEVYTTGEYWARYTDNNGCTKTDHIFITVNELPEVNLGSDISICEGDTTTLSATTSGINFLWSNNSTTSTIDVWDNALYWLQVTDAKGCQNTDSVKVHYFTPVNVNIGNDTTICSNASITLSANMGAYSYLWSTGESSRSITVTNTGQYSVMVTDINNCSYSDSITISHHIVPAINLGADITICQRDTTEIVANLTNVSYLWNTGETTQTIRTPNEGSYIAIATDSYNCSNSDTVNVSFFTPFSVNLGDDNAFCSNETFTIDAGNAGFNFIWNTNETTQTIEIENAGTYSVVVTDGNGCTNTDTITLTTNEFPEVYIGNDTTICRGAFITLDAGTSGNSYIWSTNATTRTIKANTAGTYWVQVTNANGCVNSDTIQLLINELPQIFLGNDTTICQNLPITLDAGTNGIKYLWNTNDTTRYIVTNATGTYTATITDSNGCSNSDAINISMFEPFIVDLGTDISYCIDTIHTLDAGNPGFTYLWSTGQTTQTITVSETSSYSVTVTDNFGCPQRDTINLYFNTHPPLELGNDFSICRGSSATLDAGSLLGITYEWSTNETTQTISVNTEGQYSVTIYDIMGCTNSDTINISINELPIVSLGADTSICVGLPFTISSNFNAESYLWSDGSTSQDLVVTQIGNYWVQVTDQNGCSNSDTITLTAKSNPEVNIGDDTYVCYGSPITLDAGQDAVTYLWSDGSTQQTFTDTITTNCSFWVKITGENGCVNFDTINVQVNALPQISHSSIAPVCSNGDSITLYGGFPQNGVYTGIGVANGFFNPTITGAGTHAIAYHVTDDNGCTDSLTINVIVNQAPLINLGLDTYVNGADTTLNAGAGYTSYLWQDGSSNQTLTVTTNGNYSVTVTDANGCSNSDTISISFVQAIDLIVSQLISPNNECSVNQKYPIEVIVTNRGNKTYNANEQITIFRKANNGSYISENVTLTSNLAQNETLEYTFSNDIALNVGNHHFSFFVKYGSTNCDTLEYDATVHQSPSFSFNADTIKVNLPYELNPNIDGDYTYQWSDGSIGSTLNITQYGNYWLIITDANNCTAADTVSIISTSIGSITGINAQVLAYPNPARSNLNIAISSDEVNSYLIKLISPNGLILWQNETAASNSIIERINVSDYTPGIYFIQISAKGQTATLKAIISQ